jgi:hypothetical protein
LRDDLEQQRDSQGDKRDRRPLLAGEAAVDSLIEAEGAPSDVIAGAADNDGLAFGRPSERRGQGLATGRVETPLVAPLKRPMPGNENPGLENADLIGKNMNVENAATRRVRLSARTVST